MIALFYGGASSGKSKLAEDFAVAKNAQAQQNAEIQENAEMQQNAQAQQNAEALKSLTYLATMQPFGDAGKRRIENHKKKREGKGFEVCEQFTDIANANVNSGTVLLECVGNLLANEMFSVENIPQNVCEIILSGIEKLSQKCDNLIIVSSDLSGGCENPTAETLEYINNMQKINSGICEICNEVYRVCVGIAIKQK
ncbi:MAG: bifunctional adenosylcobinamide kinase/adenosylcobinamide-phosphate guanylyltransferase [Bacillota bacterium]